MAFSKQGELNGLPPKAPPADLPVAGQKGEVQAQSPDNGLLEKRLVDFVETAYLDYSMYVVLDRALPFFGDGLKPVQRRIIYAMTELGLSASSKPKKAARTVGDVIGKFHPHGDASCYETMVSMAQPFTMNHPFLVGQGNWGSVDDPKSFAAMRYTEAKLSAYADVLTRELSQGTVDFQQNFDGTLMEPQVLPARLPNLLLNGATGIAVGLSADILPHNLREVVAALICLLDNKKATLEDVLQSIQGPDFPGGGVIVSKRKDLLAMYRTGQGVVRLRASYVVEDKRVVITALPWQVSSTRIIDQISRQVHAKKLPHVSDLRDESDINTPVRLVIESSRRGFDPEPLIAHLLATTDLEKSCRFKFNVIDKDGRPAMKSLLDFLLEWLEFRKQTIRRRLRCQLGKTVERLEQVEGLLLVFADLDKVISIIRNSDDPGAELRSEFGLNELQLEAVLELRLRKLAKLEENKLLGERVGLLDTKRDIDRYLRSERRLVSLLKKELNADAMAFGHPRRSELQGSPAVQARRHAPLPVAAEPVTVVLSQKGWVRVVKGSEVNRASLQYLEGDAFLVEAKGLSNGRALFFDVAGWCFGLGINELAGGRNKNEPLSAKLKLEKSRQFTNVLLPGEDAHILWANSQGQVLRMAAKSLLARKMGRQLLRVEEGHKALPPVLLGFSEPAEESESLLVGISNVGRVCAVDVSELPVHRSGKGVRFMKFPRGEMLSRTEKLLLVAVVFPGAKIEVTAVTRSRRLSFSEIAANYKTSRGLRGCLLSKSWRSFLGRNAESLLIKTLLPGSKEEKK